MYSFARCAEPGCGKLAFSGELRCLDHCPDPGAAVRQAILRLESSESHRDICVAGAPLEGLNLSGRRFYGCSFVGASLKSVLFTNSVFRLCFFDDAVIDSCDFSHVDAQFCSFGGARITNVSFENSELLHAGFGGAAIRDSTFNNSNLYDSRFIRCELVNVDIVDCDMKRLYLIPSKQENVSFKYSNTNEAIRDLEHLYL